MVRERRTRAVTRLDGCPPPHPDAAGDGLTPAAADGSSHGPARRTACRRGPAVKMAMDPAKVPSIKLSMVRHALMPAVLAALICGGLSGAVWADCPAAAQQLRAALAAGDLDGARRLHDTVWREPACDDVFRGRAGRAVSLLHARIAQERLAAGASLDSQRVLLERGLEFGRTWPVLALLGDAAHDARDFGRASALYQEALAAIDDAVKTPKPPPPTEIERIFLRAGQSRMLAAEYRVSPRTRSGAPAGLAAARIRGFTVERVPLPISFHTGSAKFTGQGRRAAADMAGYLKMQNPPSIAIAGHTDPRGAEAYNLDLSRRRAEAVAAYLREQGFKGRIDVIAKGERERFPVEEASGYTREERWRMDRRVELIR